ncbi:MAG: amidohydrolase [Chloroflexota bacterium]
MLAVRNAKIYPITGAPIDNGTLLIDNGKIVAVGKDVQVPAGAEIIDATGKVVLPGFVDAHAHLGLWGEWYGQSGQDGNEGSSAMTAEVRAIDAIYPGHTSFQDARAGGVTTAQTTPGSGNAIGGEMIVIKTRGKIVDEMIVRNPSGMKAALGENPKRFHGQMQHRAPATRMGTAAIIRQAFYKARDYQRKLEAGKADPSKLPDTDLGMLNLIKVLNHEMPLRIHAHRADDIVTAVRLAEEFGIDWSIEHCTDGAVIADFLGSRKAKVNLGPTLGARSKIETRALSFANAAILHKAGCHVSIITDHPFVATQYLVSCAAMSCAEGLPEEEALKAITINPAITIGVADRVGSLEPGKDGDFVIWSDHPFKIRAKAERVFIEGKQVL